jgi:nucleoside-diphosphate-sugar epimerase
MARFTVIGARGFIGGQMIAHLAGRGHAVAAPARGEMPTGEPGHVIYCAGVTADFRTRPFDTVEAHVCHLAEVLRRTRPLSFLYLSSTRVYEGAASGDEDTPVALDPAAPGALYNATKLAGEALCLSLPQATVRVARLSNVFGAPMLDGPPRADFLAAIVREAVEDGAIRLRTAEASAKDYVAVEDVGRALERIALGGDRRLYNVAAGRNTSHAALTERLSEITGCTVEVAPGAPAVAYPQICTARLAAAFGPDAPWRPAAVLDRLPDLVAAARRPSLEPAA